MTSSSWDRYAASYGRQEWLERAAINRMLDALAIAPGERVLDAATGTGLVLRMLGRPDAIGVDASAAMLARADVPNELVRADVTALPFDDASFDVITCSYLLHVLGDPGPALREFRRVLRPGGRLGTVTVGSGLAVLAAPVRLIGGLAAAVVPRGADGRLAGLRPYDPGPALRDVGFTEAHRSRTFAGYPSLILTAQRRSAAPS